MKYPIIISLIPLLSFAAGAGEDASRREKIYSERNMAYAKKLFQSQENTPDDDLKAHKADALNYSIRNKSIQALEKYLQTAKTAEKRREILHRLSQLFDEQSDVATRREDLPNKKETIEANLKRSNFYLHTLRKEYPHWSPETVTFSLAENYTRLNDLVAAEKYYREIIQNYPTSAVVADSLLSLGNLYYDRQLFETARLFYRKILETKEANLHPFAHYKMAWCYFNETDVGSALAGLERAILESRKLQHAGLRKLSVEDEAIADTVLFFSEHPNPLEAKDYFEKLVSKERARELRFQLARRLFDHGQHQFAKVTTQKLLDEDSKSENASKLYLTMISVSDRMKERDAGLANAQKLAKLIQEKHADKNDANRIEAEEFLRMYGQKLHHEAETMKEKDLWVHARKAYEVYLSAFSEDAEAAEVKFRYAVLLLNRKDNYKAYIAVNELASRIDAKHARYQEALKLRIQAIELLSHEDRQRLKDVDVIAAYDAYSTNYPKDELSVEAQYKAANLAKNTETPEAVSMRFRTLAVGNPKHNLAKASISESIAVLVKAKKWASLEQESHEVEAAGVLKDVVATDTDLKKKITEAKELSQVMIAEDLEKQEKYPELKTHLEKVVAENPSEKMGVFVSIKLATVTEKHLQDLRTAIEQYDHLRQTYPTAPESRNALLEQARLYEQVNEPRKAVEKYVEFARLGTGKIENQALTNAAVTLSDLGERSAAADLFFQMEKNLEANGSMNKDGISALEAGCNNLLLASFQSKDHALLEKISQCSRRLSSLGHQPLVWQARAAWAMDQMADNLQADSNWKKLAAKSIKATPESERAYIVAGKIHLLKAEVEEFKTLKFTKTNERPEANLSKKTNAMEKIEHSVEVIVKTGTQKQGLQAKNLLRAAYQDFAETLELAATPSKLTDAEKEELKKSFVAFGQEFLKKAQALDSVQSNSSSGRAIASVANVEGEEILWTKDAEGKLMAAHVPSSSSSSTLSSEEEALLKAGKEPAQGAAALYAKKAFQLYKDGKFGDAHYFAEKWKRNMNASLPGYDKDAWESFHNSLSEKLPESDPMNDEL